MSVEVIIGIDIGASGMSPIQLPSPLRSEVR